MYKYITIAKGIGILLVIAGHFTSIYYSPSFYDGLRDWLYSFHMPLFMALSGFLFNHSLQKTSEKTHLLPFIRKKFLRLMVPYFFVSFFIAAFKELLGKGRIVNTSYLRELCYMNVGGIAVFLWFLYALFIIFVVVGFCMQFKYGFACLGAFSITIFFLPFPEFLFLSYVHIYLLYFWLGMLLHRSVQIGILSFSAKEFFFALFFFTVAYACHTMGHSGFLKMLENLLCGIFGSYAIICFSKYLSTISSFFHGGLLNIGKKSSFIYLMHMIGVSLVCALYEKIEVYTPFTYLVALILALLAGVLLSLLIERYLISHSKCLTWLMGGK